MLHGLKYDFIEDLLINLRLLKPPPAVLAENGVMRYRIGQRKTNKPTVGDVDPDFLNEASFRTNSVQKTDQKHVEQHDRIDARTPIILTIQGAAFFRDKRKVDGFIDFSKQVILGNKVFYVDCFGLKFPGWVRPEHIKTFLRNCFIPNSTKKAVDPSLSTASSTARWPFISSGEFRRAAGRETLRLLLALFPPLPFLGGDGEEKVVVKPPLKVCRFPKRSLHPESEAKRYRLAGYVGGGAADFDPVDRPLFDQVIDQGGGRQAHD